jgi:hypothetical protein
VASLDDCAKALQDLSDRIASVDADSRHKHAIDRSVSVEVSDLATTFTGRLDGDGLHDIITDATKRAQIRLTTSSDDLVAVTSGSLSFASAWSSGRLKVDANPLDLLRLRSLL